HRSMTRAGHCGDELLRCRAPGRHGHCPERIEVLASAHGAAQKPVGCDRWGAAALAPLAATADIEGHRNFREACRYGLVRLLPYCSARITTDAPAITAVFRRQPWPSSPNRSAASSPLPPSR